MFVASAILSVTTDDDDAHCVTYAHARLFKQPRQSQQHLCIQQRRRVRAHEHNKRPPPKKVAFVLSCVDAVRRAVYPILTQQNCQDNYWVCGKINQRKVCTHWKRKEKKKQRAMQILLQEKFARRAVRGRQQIWVLQLRRGGGNFNPKDVLVKSLIVVLLALVSSNQGRSTRAPFIPQKWRYCIF